MYERVGPLAAHSSYFDQRERGMIQSAFNSYSPIGSGCDQVDGANICQFVFSLFILFPGRIRNSIYKKF